MADDSWQGVADVHSEASDGNSFSAKAADWVTKGIPVALASGVTSVLNTGISLGNMFGDFEKIDLARNLKQYDDDLSRYYEEHQAGADLGGFLATSLIPGTLGMKGLKALQLMKDGEGIGKNVGTIAGYFAAKQEKYLTLAAETISGPAQQTFSLINKQKALGIAAGFGEQALQGAAFETGVLLTMNQNPVMEPSERDNYVQAIIHHIPALVGNSLVFGAVGGTLGAATFSGKINQKIVEEDLKQFSTLYAFRPGVSNLNPGTMIAHDFGILEDLKSTLKQMEELVGAPREVESIVNEKSVLNQRQTLQNFQNELDLFITKKLVDRDSVELAQALREAIYKVAPSEENGMPVAASELIARTLGGVKKATRLGDIQSLMNKFPEYEQFHGSAGPVEGGFKRDVRGSYQNIMGPGVYTTDAYDIAKQYSMRGGGGGKPTIYGFREREGVNLPLYDLNLPITEEIKNVIRTTDAEFANFGRLDSAKTLQDFYLEASRRSIAEAALPTKELSDAFQAIRDYFEGLGYRGLTHEGGILGGAKHKVKIYWYPESDLSFSPVPVTREGMLEGAVYLTNVVPNKLQRIVKLTGNDAGKTTEYAYPAAGDIGRVTMKNNELYIDGIRRELSLDYNPLENTPSDSSMQFLKQRLSSRMTAGDSIPYNNLPLLEKAYLENMNGKITVAGNPSPATEDNLADILRYAKKDALNELTLKGRDLEYMQRALNVPREFLDNPETGELTLSTLEDHTKPLYAKMNYAGTKEMNSFVAEGMARVQQSVAISTAVRENAARFIFGESSKFFPDAVGRLEGVVTRSGASSLFRSSDAARGSTMMNAMQVGKMIDKLSKQAAADWQNILYPIREEILANPEFLYKRNINAGTLRATSEDMIRVPEEVSGIYDKLIIAPRSWVDLAIKDTDPAASIKKFMTEAPTNTIVEDLGSPEARYLITRQQLTAEQANKWNVANAARGSSKKIAVDTFYEPPIDTAKQPYFVMVRYNNPLDDLRPFSMIVAQSAENLAAKMKLIEAKFGDTVEMYTKDEIKLHKELEGTYDSGMLFGKTSVDSELYRKGILSDFVPRKDAYIFTEENNWIWRQQQAMHRQGAELLYGSEMAELRFMENNWNKINSRFNNKLQEYEESDIARNPYSQVINTYLNLSNKGAYDAMWGKLNQGAQAAWAQMTTAWEEGFKAANKGELTYQAAEKIARQAGYTAPFGELTREVFNETFKDNNSLSKLVSKVNMAVSTLMIRMDTLNSLINIMSLPVLLSSESSAIRREIQTKLGLEVTVPGTDHRIPSLMSLLMDGTKSYLNKEIVTINNVPMNLKEYFTNIGAIRTNPQLIQDSLAIPLDAVRSGEKGLIAYAGNLASRVGEFSSRWTGNDLAEEFVRYQAAYAGLKFAQAQGITSSGDLAAYVNLMVNRVHGNYLASQRPTIFSGPVGQAISLFQTYQFNMIQQMTRYLQEGNYKSVAVAAGMQNAIFGLQGNPLFWQLNKYIGNMNTEHGDIVTGTSELIGTGGGTADPAKWLLYGLGANTLQVNLYNRGDLTPRFTTILPTGYQDIPAISIGTKAIGSFLDSMKAIANGAPVSESILQGIAHAGFNRPLAGLATLAVGRKTTGSGSLLAAYNDIDAALVAAKLAGGEPLNNAIAFDAYNRLQGYKAENAKRMQDLGEAVKFTSAGGRGIDPDQTENFMRKYAEKGGNIQHFNQSVTHWMKDSDQSVVNKFKDNMRNPLAQKTLSWLGADLEDENNIPGSSGSLNQLPTPPPP